MGKVRITEGSAELQFMYEEKEGAPPVPIRTDGEGKWTPPEGEGTGPFRIDLMTNRPKRIVEVGIGRRSK